MYVKIIVDSTADLIPEIRERVEAVPLNIRFGDREFADGVNIDAPKFYEMLASCTELPTTSQPTPAAFEDVYRRAVEAGCQVVCITIASQLSGTYQSASIAAEEFPGQVFVVDSSSAAIGAGILTEYALRLADQGRSAPEIRDELLEKRNRIRLYAVVDTLEYLKKGGRLSSAVAMVGGLLNIKPVICLNDGQIQVAGTARGRKKAYEALSAKCREQGGPDETMPMLLGYTGNDDSQLLEYMEQYRQLWPLGTRTSIVGPTIGVHAGPGAVAVAFFSAE